MQSKGVVNHWVFSTSSRIEDGSRKRKRRMEAFPQPADKPNEQGLEDLQLSQSTGQKVEQIQSFDRSLHS